MNFDVQRAGLGDDRRVVGRFRERQDLVGRHVVPFRVLLKLLHHILFFKNFLKVILKTSIYKLWYELKKIKIHNHA